MSNSSSFSLQHIILLSSNFQRSWQIDFDNEAFKSSIDIEVTDTRQNNILSVVVDLKFDAGIKDSSDIKAQISMAGVFNGDSNGGLDTDQFAKVNAPAIIFPFIREHLSSLSVKAGISPILLAPVNFVKHSESRRKPNESNL